MARFLRILLAVLVFAVLLTPSAFAARITMSSDSLSGKTGDTNGIAVSVILKEGDYDTANPSSNEKAQFVVESPREGDRCVTNPAPSDSSGKVTGTCYASKPGSVSIYAKSTDRGDQSEKVTLEFSDAKDDASKPADDKPPSDNTSAEEAKKAAAMKQYQAQQATQQAGAPPGGGAGSALANQPGLAPDKDNGMAGLGSGSVEGAATASNENNPRSDLDLINSLIYLVAGVVLIIACLYFIWFQMKEHQVRMDKKKKDGGDPPSIPPSPTHDIKTESPAAATTPVPPPPIPPIVTNAVSDKPPGPSYDPTAEKQKPSEPPNSQLADPKPSNAQTIESQPEPPQQASTSKPTLAELRRSMPAAPNTTAVSKAEPIPPVVTSTATVPTAKDLSTPQPTNMQTTTHEPATTQQANDDNDEDVPDHASWSVDAIAKRITDEINKTKNSA